MVNRYGRYGTQEKSRVFVSPGVDGRGDGEPSRSAPPPEGAYPPQFAAVRPGKRGWCCNPRCAPPPPGFTKEVCSAQK